ncbi:MAG: hypothetical protein HUJ94_05490 [Bacteroidales bacterium]|nr:hypothetical protein [Bacteroidales bacterium]
MRRFAIMAAIMLTAAVSCGPGISADEDSFVSDASTDICFSMNGTDMFSFDEKTWQLSWSDGGMTFRAMDDNLENWFSVSFSRLPVSEGESVKCQMKWFRAGGSHSATDMSFTLVRSSGNVLRLWDRKNQVGLVIHKF